MEVGEQKTVGHGIVYAVLLKVVVQFEVAVTLVAAKHVVHLGNLDFYDLDILQHLGGSHRFFLIHNLLSDWGSEEAPQGCGRASACSSLSACSMGAEQRVTGVGLSVSCPQPGR
ncbi:hypothetical protein INR49_032191 [Caranx melampygus]|nr:hypothetical protein INR49_032191 [Caranx melampygus]